MIKVTWRSLKTKGLNTPVMDMFFVFVGESNFYVYKKWSKDPDLEHRASFFLFKFQPSQGGTKTPVQTSPWTFNVWSPSPGFMFMMGVFIPLFRALEVWFDHRLGFRSAAMFSEVRWKFEKISIVCNQILPKKKKQTFFKEICGLFFLRMEGGSKPGELSVEMGIPLRWHFGFSASARENFSVELTSLSNHGTFADGLGCCYDGAMTET